MTAPPSAEQRPVHVVIGPKTRLGTELVGRLVARGEQVCVLARDDADHAALARGPAAVLRVRPEVEEPLFAELRPSAVYLHVCALGPVHPTAPDVRADAATVDRDLAVIAQLLRCAAAPTIHLVLVSTVLALAPGVDRRYYGGWKGVVEQQLRELVARRPDAALSVLYPGRLVTDADVRRPWHRAHTRYRRLAELSVRAAEAPADRVVGADARIWLLLRGLRVALSSVWIGGAYERPLPEEPETERLQSVSQEITS